MCTILRNNYSKYINKILGSTNDRNRISKSNQMVGNDRGCRGRRRRRSKQITKCENHEIVKAKEERESEKKKKKSWNFVLNLFWNLLFVCFGGEGAR